MISRATADDAPAAAALLRVVRPGELSAAAHVRHRIESAQPEERAAWWKAADDSGVVGWASAALDSFSAEPGRALASLAVHPRSRGRGIGTALWEAVETHLAHIEARRVSISSRDDDAAARFARARLFHHASSDTLLEVDPRRVDSATAPAGVEVRAMTAFVADPQPVYRCDAETTKDEPGPFNAGAMTFEVWRRHVWELSLAAVVGGDVVGTTFLCTDRETGQGLNGGTGVARAFRGRGLGFVLKRQSLALAAEAGITRVVTHNNEANAPMLAINRRLGYRPLATCLWWQRER
jgi:GNAT superfamily N-acetyltransferase